MRKVWLAGLGLGLLGVGWWAGAHHSTVPADSPSTPLVSGVGSQHTADDDRVARGDTDADGEQVAALRAQLRERDKLLGAMALQNARAQQANAQQASAATKALETPTARAIRKLNQRLFGGAPSEPGARDVKAAMEVATSGLPSTVKATVDCSSELCRVSIEGAEDQLDRDSGQLLERVPKKFAGTILLPDGQGRRVLYAAMRQELLSVSDQPADK
jgi:hypothetical protein